MDYDPLLKARKIALMDLSEDMTDEEYVIAERGIDKFLDILEEVTPKRRGSEPLIVSEYDTRI